MAAVMTGLSLLAPVSAFAQCTDTFNYVGVVSGSNVPVQNLLPLGSGSSLAVLTSTINTVNTAFLASTSAFVSAPGGAKPDERGNGLWTRGIAGSVETKTNSVGVLDTSAVSPAVSAATGTQNCKTTIRQSYAGIQLGYDFAILNRGGTGENWHFGVTGGQVVANLKDATPGTTYTNNYPATLTVGAGQLTQDTQVPYVGLYTTYTRSGFFADGMLRWDFYRNQFSDPGNGLTTSKGFDATGFSALGNMGYTFPLRDGWFLEPSSGMMYSKVSVDQLSISAFGGQYASGTVSINDIESLIGRFTLRFGRNFTMGNYAYQPFFSAGVFHEFLGNVTATSIENSTTSSINGLKLTTTSKDGLGTYGQFSLGTAVVLPNNITTFVRGDYRTGEHIESWGINGGVRFNF
jgi:outer membrane autotransporter protein